MTGQLFDQHRELLEARAILPAVAEARGYDSTMLPGWLRQQGFSIRDSELVPGLVIPIHDVHGALASYQYRPDNPRIRDGKPAKYLRPHGARNVLDVPPQILGKLADPRPPLWVTESPLKADAAVSAGLVCIATFGVWGWKGSNSRGGKLALPDWEHIAIAGRDVYLVPDSDVTTNEKVANAVARLGRMLASRDANVRYVTLPPAADGTKTGLDDYLARGGDPQALMFTLADDEPPALADTGTPRKTGAHPHTPPLTSQNRVCAPDGVCAHTPDLASADDLLAAAVDTVHELGVTGEVRIIKGTYLTALSQVFAEPVSLAVKGSSAAGKSYSTKTTLRLFPAEDFYSVTAGSQRALIYTEEEFKHRTIVLYEATALREVAEQRDGDMTAMLVRTLLTEGHIIYDVTERGDDGKTAVRRIVKSGPTNLIVTTTADNLHHENETRLLSLTVDESEDQTRAVMAKIAWRRNQLVPPEPPDLAPWHALFHWLKHHGEHRVYIPYAGYLSGSAAASAIRMRRDFSVLLGMIEASAVLHQASRKRDGYGRIIATATDYDTARDILAEAFAVSSGRKVKDTVRRAVVAVDELGGEHSDVLVAQVARNLKRDRAHVGRGLREAADLGYLTNRETKPGRAARYRTGPDQLPDDKPALPGVLPDDAGDTRTPAQVAHLTPQVSEGCAGVRVCAGGPGDDDAVNLHCAVCGNPMDPYVTEKTGETTHPNCDPRWPGP